jgi:hypothetical protein
MREVVIVAAAALLIGMWAAALVVLFCGETAAMEPRRFPPPWTVEDIGAAFVVKDSAGQKLACVYFEDEPGRRSDFLRRKR